MKLPSQYEPARYEADIYSLWEKSRVFTPKKATPKDSYSIMMPLPNANARLHLGSALFVALQDITSRYQRLKGKEVLWLPGADHAGFETWVVYEKQLEKQGKSRFDYSREQLYKQVWDFVAANRHQFERQFRELGASVDWSRFTFSLDDKIVAQVYKTFKQLWDDGLIYRGERIVNFCTFHGTSFADIEVEYREDDGQLWYLNYPLTDGAGQITVATSRPETMLGDTAVAVNPSDKRYKKYIGKTARLPLTNREVPIIADDFVDIKFGTGAVKLTPAHDINDFEAATRHGLPMITIIDHEGKLNANVPESYRGLTVEKARKKVAEDLEKQGFIAKVEPYKHSVGHCYKCDTVIEPLLRDQWFVDMKSLAADAIAALKAKKIKFYPDNKRSQLIRYLEGLRDWNISRQIAWGIPIPAFVNIDDPDDWIFDDRVGEAEVKVGGKTYRRDPDVFDTWFSSGQWPFATLGIGSADFQQFYPTSLMETGGEILYPWVSRMIMLGLYMTSEIPFKEVYIHGYVLAPDGAKMSKSLGNVIDPDDYRTKYGADALRLGLIDDRAAAINRPFDETKAVAGRNFCNKLWNVARFYEGLAAKDSPATKTAADHWILNKLTILQGTYTKGLDNYDFSGVYAHLYQFVWNDLADWYVEASKTAGATSPKVFGQVLQSTLKLAHPFAPFVTEAIWQQLEFGGMLASSLLPEKSDYSTDESRKFDTVRDIATQTRRLSAVLGDKLEKIYYQGDSAAAKVIEGQAQLLKDLAGLKQLEATTGKPTDGLRLPIEGLDVWAALSEAKIKIYRDFLASELKSHSSAAELLTARLKNKAYVAKAPKHLIKETQDSLAEAENLIAQIEAELKTI